MSSDTVQRLIPFEVDSEVVDSEEWSAHGSSVSLCRVSCDADGNAQSSDILFGNNGMT